MRYGVLRYSKREGMLLLMSEGSVDRADLSLRLQSEAEARNFNLPSRLYGAASKLPFLQALVETESAARREMIIRVAC